VASAPDQSLWTACNGPTQLKKLSGQLFRLVESQQQVATLSYVDTLAEQAVLEQLLENSKPALPQATEPLHYLLKSPFRYPPLDWGSRFGAVAESGIFYGACAITTTLAESAYYRFIFWYSIEAAAPKTSLRSQHSLLSVGYSSSKAVALHQPPFSTYSAELTAKTNYQHSQQLGTAMRNAGVELFEYQSARDPNQGICVGLFSPKAFTSTKPDHTSLWLCEINAGLVVFKQQGEAELYQYPLELFLLNGELPWPG
jgi:hypothetical protein